MSQAASESRVRPDSALLPTLRGRWLLLARAGWLVTAVVTVGLWTAGFVQLLRGGERYYLPGMAQALAELGLSGQSVVIAAALLMLLLPAASFVVTALVIFWRKADDPMAYFVSLALLTFASVTQTTYVLQEAYPALRLPVTGVWIIGLGSMTLLLYLFPDGRFVPGWTRVLVAPTVAVWSLLAVPGVAVGLFGFAGFPTTVPPWLRALFVGGVLALALVGLCAQVYRYRRVSGPMQRQQTKWVLLSIGVLVSWFVFLLVIPRLFWTPPVLWTGWVLLLTFIPVLLVPLSVAVAILRYRLYDIDLLINRALVYGTLTGILALIYVGGVVSLQSIFRTMTGQDSDMAIVASTLAIAGLFQPLRRRIQAVIDRRFYRRKYDTQRTLAAFAATLRDETDLERISADLLGVVEETMQPEHVSLWLRPPKPEA